MGFSGFCSLLMTPNRFWTMATDALPPQDATALAEDLGIEFDTDEHIAVERGPLCALPNLKRKRV
jgi:26S proteasome regulatory subunit (ATPase 3-interacting protein)